MTNDEMITLAHLTERAVTVFTVGEQFGLDEQQTLDFATEGKIKNEMRRLIKMSMTDRMLHVQWVVQSAKKALEEKENDTTEPQTTEHPSVG